MRRRSDGTAEPKRPIAPAVVARRISAQTPRSQSIVGNDVRTRIKHVESRPSPASCEHTSAVDRRSAPASMTAHSTFLDTRNAARYGMSSGGNGRAPSGYSCPNPPIESLLETNPVGLGGLSTKTFSKRMEQGDFVQPGCRVDTRYSPVFLRESGVFPAISEE